MAFIYGKSNNATVAEKRRLSHGFFLIPFPEGSSREERPFGIRLCGHHQIDYERVQIRIAAVQHGFKVLVDNEGQLIPPAVFSEKVKEIQEISEELEYIYEQQVLRRKFTPEDVPVGYIPGLGHNPATLPKQSSRQRKAAKNAWSVIRSFNVRSSRQNGGTGLRRGRRNTALPRPAMKPPAGKLPPADPRYQAYWKDILWRKYEHKGFDKLKKMVSQEENRFTVSGGRHIIRRLEELLNEVVQDFEYLGRIISQNDVEEVLARRELLCPQEFDLQSELRVINQEPMAWFEQICRPRTRRDRLVPLVYSPSAVLTKNELRTELTDAEFFALVETM